MRPFSPSASSYQIFKHFETPSNNFTAVRNASPYHFVCGEDQLSYSLCIHAELPALKSRLRKMVFSDIPVDLVSINRDRAAKARKILGESRRRGTRRGERGGKRVVGERWQKFCSNTLRDVLLRRRCTCTCIRPRRAGTPMQIGKVGPGLTYLSAFVFPEVPLTLCKQCCQARRKSISSRARACRDPALSGFGFDYLNPMYVCLAEFSLSCVLCTSVYHKLM